MRSRLFGLVLAGLLAAAPAFAQAPNIAGGMVPNAPTLFAPVNPETKAYASAVVAAAGAANAADPFYLLALDSFITTGKRDGWWTTTNVDSGVFAGGNLTASLVKLLHPAGVAASLVNTNFVAGDFDPVLGLGNPAGNNSSKLLSTGIIPANQGMSKDSVTIVMCLTDQANLGVGTGYPIGDNPVSTDSLIFVSGTNIGLSGNGATRGQVGTGCPGYTGNGNTQFTYVDGVKFQQGAVAPPAVTLSTEVTLWGQNKQSAMRYSDGRGDFYWIGPAITEAQLQSLTRAARVLQNSRRRLSRRCGFVPLGDSIAAGQGTTGSNAWLLSWASLTMQALGMDLYNMGLPSSTMTTVNAPAGVPAGINRYLDLIPLNPCFIALAYGTNDANMDPASNGTAGTITTFQANSTTVLQQLNLQNAGSNGGTLAAKMVVVGPPYNTTSNPTKLTAYNVAAAAAARAAGVPFVDAYNAILDTGNAASFMTDANHPNLQGHRLIANKVIAAYYGKVYRDLSLTFGAVVPGTPQTQNVTIYGVTPPVAGGTTAKPSPMVTVTPDDGGDAGCVYSGYVSANDVVTAVANCILAITPAARFFTVSVVQP